MKASRPSASPAPNLSAEYVEAAEELNIGLMLRYTMRAFTVMLQMIAAQQGLTASEFRVLRTLASGGPLTQVRLAALAAMDRPYAAQIVKQLRGKDLVRPESDSNDGRRVLLRLTPAGLAITQAVALQLDRVNELALQGVTPAQAATFTKVMSRMRQNMEALALDGIAQIEPVAAAVAKGGRSAKALAGAKGFDRSDEEAAG